MAGIGEVASIIGVVTFGFQTARLLQDEIDSVLNADQRIQQIVIRIQATAYYLKDLKKYLAPGSSISGQRRREYEIIIHQCDSVFRRVIVLIAKAGRKVLRDVDDYQERIREGEDPKTFPLHIQLCKLESLSWPWKMKKIEQCIADLDGMKRDLNDRINLAHAAQAGGLPLDDDSDYAGGEEQSDRDPTMLPVVELIEEDEDAALDADTDGITDWYNCVSSGTSRYAHQDAPVTVTNEGKSSPQRRRRRRKRTTQAPLIIEEVVYQDRASSESSDHYDTNSDSSRSIDIGNNRSRKRSRSERGHRVQHGEEDEVVPHRCTIL